LGVDGHQKNFDYFVGHIVRNPFESVDSKRRYNFDFRTYIPTDPPGVHVVKNMAHYEGLLLSIHFHTDHWSTVEGSAVMVAPGIALAATHVIEPLKPHLMASELRVLCVGLTSSGPRIWLVKHVTPVSNTDLTLLSLEYASAIPEDHRFVQAAVTTRLPKIGEPVMIVGIRASDQYVTMDEDKAFAVKDNKIEYGAEVRVGVGEVTEHRLDGYGSRLPGPLIEVACSTAGGLSGGPAFDKDGRVLGILAVSFDDPDGREPSHVSLLWPALAQPITPAFLPEGLPASIKLLEFEYCNIDHREFVSFSMIAGTDNIEVRYDDQT
jgi:hypothetical protein